LVLPLERALCDGFILLVDKDGLDTCGTEFDSQNGLTGLDGLFRVHCNIGFEIVFAKVLLFLRIAKLLMIYFIIVMVHVPFSMMSRDKIR
jgi:hypothetical protein